jgi:hypothetical protein
MFRYQLLPASRSSLCKLFLSLSRGENCLGKKQQFVQESLFKTTVQNTEAIKADLMHLFCVKIKCLSCNVCDRTQTNFFNI